MGGEVVTGTPSHPLADHLRWLESIGAKPCICRYEWKSLGLHEGHGWVRMNTENACLEHGPEAVKAWRAERAQRTADS